MSNYDGSTPIKRYVKNSYEYDGSTPIVRYPNKDFFYEKLSENPERIKEMIAGFNSQITQLRNVNKQLRKTLLVKKTRIETLTNEKARLEKNLSELLVQNNLENKNTGDLNKRTIRTYLARLLIKK